jgi:hypothetical protein
MATTSPQIQNKQHIHHMHSRRKKEKRREVKMMVEGQVSQLHPSLIPLPQEQNPHFFFFFFFAS